MDFEGRAPQQAEFHNTGLYNIAGLLSYPAPNTGVYDVTKKPDDVGKFKAPTLRNIAVTAPYMHDGSIPTLDQAVDHEIYYRGFSRGKPINLSLAERQAIVAFLETLTDESGQHSMSNRPKIR